MGWREELRPASFRGVPFQVLDSTFEGGRRHAVHEYPQRDNPFVEDLGRMAESFRLEAFILGDDYMARRNALARVCRTRGTTRGLPGGELVHPYLGSMQVVCEGFRIRETFAEGRMARVSLRFREAGAEARPLSGNSSASRADAQSSALNGLSAAQIARVLKTAGHAQEVRDSTAGVLRDLGGIMEAVDLTGAARDVAAFRDRATSLINDAAVLATAPASLAAAVWDAADAILVAAGNAAEGLFAYEALFGIDNSIGGGSSTVEKSSDGNKLATVAIVQAAAIGGAMRAAVRADFDSLPESEAARDRLLARIDILAETADDDTYQALRDLQATASEGIPKPGRQLAELEEVVLAETIPSLVLAWDLYGDASRESEIVARNNVPRPGFLPAGVPLQVLVDA